MAGAPLAASARGPARVNLDVREAPLVSVLGLIAAEAHQNLVAGDDVKGTVTISLRNVRWQLALRVVAASKGYEIERVGNVVRVASPKTFAAEREAELARKKAREAKAPLVTRFIPVSYARAEDLVPAVKMVLTDRGRVTVDKRTNTLIVTDVAKR